MVTDLKPSDYYWRTKHNKTGVVIITTMSSKEFGTYCSIHFARSDNGFTNCDIYRVSDSAPDKIIGSVNWRENYMGPFVAIDLLSSDIPQDKYFKSYVDAIHHIINLSEKELESHFNSLEFA